MGKSARLTCCRLAASSLFLPSEEGPMRKARKKSKHRRTQEKSARLLQVDRQQLVLARRKRRREKKKKKAKRRALACCRLTASSLFLPSSSDMALRTSPDSRLRGGEGRGAQRAQCSRHSAGPVSTAQRRGGQRRGSAGRCLAGQVMQCLAGQGRGLGRSPLLCSAFQCCTARAAACCQLRTKGRAPRHCHRGATARPRND